MAAGAGCGSRAHRPVGVDELRYRIAEAPSDDEARRRLAHALAERGQRGAALEHLEVLIRRDATGPAERTLAAALLVARARARLDRNDPSALDDCEGARGQDPFSVPDALLVRALEARLADELRTQGQASPALLRRLRGLAPKAEVLVIAADPNVAELESVGAAGSWLWSRGVRALAYRWLDSYVQRGGASTAVLVDYSAARRWWRPRGRLGLAVQERLAGANAILCGLVPDCPDVVRALAEPGLDAVLWTSAEGMEPTTDPVRAAAWVVVGLRQWIDDPRAGWLARVAERVDLKRAAAGPALPPFAAATLLRASGGQAEASARALDAAVAQFRELTPIERDVVAAELAVRRDPRAWELEPSPLARRLRARAAALEPALATHSPDAGEAGVLAGATALDRRLAAAWWRLPIDHRALAARLGLVRPTARAASAWASRAMIGLRQVRESERERLLAIIDAFGRDPVRSDRLAAELVSGPVLPTPIALAVADLYRHLGDPGRARQWVEVAGKASPRDPDVLFARGVAAAAVGALSEAEVHFTNAAGRSGDAGDVYARAAESMLALGKPVWALFYGHRAQELMPAQGRHALYRTLRAAARELGRADLVDELGAQLPEVGAPAVDVTDVESALASGDAERVRVAAAWNPRSAAARVFLIERAGAGKGEGLAAELAAIAMFDADDAEAHVAAQGLIRYYLEQRRPAAARVFERLDRGLSASGKE